MSSKSERSGAARTVEGVAGPGRFTPAGRAVLDELVVPPGRPDGDLAAAGQHSTVVEHTWPGQERAGWVTLRHNGHPGYLFRIIIGPKLVPVGFEVRPESDEFDQPLTVSRLRSFRFGEISSDAVRWYQRLAEANTRNERLGAHSERARKWLGGASWRRPGRRGRPDEDYAALAQLYVDKVDAGRTAPVKELAEELGYSASQIRNRLYEARRRGLLTPAPPGREGGRLTQRAEQLLSGKE
jgi:hypothetical protein